MADHIDKRIEELRQYIPPYTAPNHPPQVEVITTTNTGDTPMTDALDRMRAESDWLKAELTLRAEIERLRKERDEARREVCAARRELCRNEAIIRLQRNRVHRDSEDVVGLAKEISVERGWDCFKDNP